MKFKPTTCGRSGASPSRHGFTLVEVLAALVFMAIVIPAAIQGVRIASMAGQMGERKASAARIADHVLNELVVTGLWQTGYQSGTVQDGAVEYKWQMRTEPWYQQNVLRLMTVEVTYPVQGQEYQVHLSTIVDATLQ
ncbi:MAG: type II secretion system protein [Verrucomicrobiia bacterium]